LFIPVRITLYNNVADGAPDNLFGGEELGRVVGYRVGDGVT